MRIPYLTFKQVNQNRVDTILIYLITKEEDYGHKNMNEIYRPLSYDPINNQPQTVVKPVITITLW